MAKVKYYAKENSSIGTHSFYAVPIPNGTLTFDELLDAAMDGRVQRMDYSEVVKAARQYLENHFGGSFEKFAEWGLIY